MTSQNAKPRVAILTVGRSDFGIIRPLVEAMVDSDDFDAGLWVTGAHYDQSSGNTIDEVRASELPIWAELPLPTLERDPAGSITTAGMIFTGYAEHFATGPRPDLLVILGDRYEAFAVGSAATLANLPIAHISGGSITEGAIDDVLRHCLTLMADIHFCDTLRFAQRINQLGARPESIHVVGALGLDGIRERANLNWDELVERVPAMKSLGGPGYFLVTIHPETRRPGVTAALAKASTEALGATRRPVLYTHPNADAEARGIIEAIDEACATHPNHVVVPNLGATNFYAAMDLAAAMVGNSSSGIIEAASFGLPVLNIGDRQLGRFCGRNVVHCSAAAEEISCGLEQVTSKEFRDDVRSDGNPYGDGRAATRVMSSLITYFQGTPSPLHSFSEYQPARVAALNAKDPK